MLNYYFLVSLRHGLEPSVDIFCLLFEMKLLDCYDCYVVFSHRDRGLPTHEHFKIPNCPSSNSGWKNRYFVVKPGDGMFAFSLNWSPPPIDDFNWTPVLTEPEIDSMIILWAIEPLGHSMNDILTDDALVSTGIGRLYDMSADQFSKAFLEELAMKNARGLRKRHRDRSFAEPHSSDVVPLINHQKLIPVDSSPVAPTAVVP
ncbi:Uncharacterized protein Adt_38689 [Abeliophyllum distichum]|uniref:Uncharacterized protein n=1 Tax=Abeliophyllum distichum TaxID=126358 RepID=A0ABD1Q2Z9_9LAMI